MNLNQSSTVELILCSTSGTTLGSKGLWLCPLYHIACLLGSGLFNSMVVAVLGSCLTLESSLKPSCTFTISVPWTLNNDSNIAKWCQPSTSPQEHFNLGASTTCLQNQYHVVNSYTLTNSASKLGYSLGHLWNVATVFWLQGNTLFSDASLNHSRFFSPSWPEPQIIIQNIKFPDKIFKYLSNIPLELHRPAFHHLHCSQQSYLPKSHRTVHRTMVTEWIFQPKDQMPPQSSPKTHGQVFCSKNLFQIPSTLSGKFSIAVIKNQAKETWDWKSLFHITDMISVYPWGKSGQELKHGRNPAADTEAEVMK